MAKKDQTAAGSEENNTTSTFTPKVKKQLNFPVLSQKKIGAIIYVLILSAIHVSKTNIEPKPGEDKEKPSDIVIALDLETGELVTVIISAVAKGLLEENYPEIGYKGLSFMFCNKGKREGKRYNDIEMTEIETPEGIDMEALISRIPQV